MSRMQDELVRALRQCVLRRAAEEEEDWGELARPEVAAELRRQANGLE